MRSSSPGARDVRCSRARAHGNLSSVGGDGREHGRERAASACVRDRSCAALARGRQVHGAHVVLRRCRSRRTRGRPASRPTARRRRCAGWGRWCSAPTACPSRSAASGAVAMLHAGWRGLAAGVLEEGVRALRELGARGARSSRSIGPGAGVCCYEVGEEVHAALRRRSRASARSRIDLRAIARERAARGRRGRGARRRACARSATSASSRTGAKARARAARRRSRG